MFQLNSGHIGTRRDLGSSRSKRNMKTTTLAISRILAVFTVQIFLFNALPWQGRRSSSVPTSYRLDAWSQYNNPEEGSDREGDIHEIKESRKTTTRDVNLLWTDRVVRYYVDELIVNEPAKLAVLEDAMSTIEGNTCLKFVRIFPEDGKFPRTSWVNVTGDQRGCFSDLGRSAHGPSTLNLNIKRCFRTRGHALHEILHTLGVYHEHMRPDRDEHIDILWENIKDGDDFNFRVLSERTVTNYGLPYDYDSVMHYSMTSFAKDKSMPTIVPRREDVTIGQRNHLSSMDIKKLLITYNCDNMNEVVAYPTDEDHSHTDQLEILNLKTPAEIPGADIVMGGHGQASETPGIGSRSFNPQRPTSQLHPQPKHQPELDYHSRPIILPIIIRPQVTVSCSCPGNPFYNLYYHYYHSKPRARFFDYYDDNGEVYSD